MRGDSGQVLVCAACGSSRVRSSRPHGLGERLARTLRAVRFHVCKDCGARGTHRGGRGAHRVRREGPPGRGHDSRERRATRMRGYRRVSMLALAVLLGAWLGLRAVSCATPPAPPADGGG